MNAGVNALALIACIAATPCAGGNDASPFITNVENPQNTPATIAVPSSPSTVSTKYGPSIMSAPTSIPRIPKILPRTHRHHK
ncbi:hypothetical protein SBD_2602 [Streptomyces bottropensis ATCC 25435]|uniref:Lipoprotein n=1 Tax=Streptomyces bottropensis ATCC 25435 TaxID=1054862 RepID=M3F1C3_9ACTN|nr:hypothetical protein SBD_2602 [Streptomyces bottropensis ATCC 25435]